MKRAQATGGPSAAASQEPTGLKYVPGSGHAGERPGTCTCT
jgi:hypothetical protein